MTSFRLLLLADIHGNAQAIRRILTHEKASHLNAILIAGDLPITTPLKLMMEYILKKRNLNKTEYSKWVYKASKARKKFVKHQISSVERILNLLEGLDVPVLYVPGNVDCLETLEFIDDNCSFLFRIDKVPYSLGMFEVFGVGGSLRHISPGEEICDFEFSQRAFGRDLKGMAHKLRKSDPRRVIFISHEPPLFKIPSKTNEEILGGSSAISKFLRQVQPCFALCGHWHEFPKTGKLGSTTVVNPGALAIYRFGYIELTVTPKGEKPLSPSLYFLNKPFFDSINWIYRSRLPKTDIEFLQGESLTKTLLRTE